VVRTFNIETLEGWIRAEGIRSLLPEQLAGSFPLNGDPAVLDVLPLADGKLALIRCGDRLLAIPLAGSGTLRRARAGDGVFAALVGFIGEAAVAGAFTGRPSAAVPAGTIERAIQADQSNDSVVVDEAVVVKVFGLPGPSPHPAVEISLHLAEVGFEETPRLTGSLAWSGDEGELLLATATELLPDAREGWDWHVQLLEEITDGGRPPAAWARPAADLGALVARLHVALATASPVFPTPRSLATTEDVASWIERSSATLEEALALTDGPEGERLREHELAIRRSLAAATAVTATPVTVIHGDLHVGQLLPWRDGFAVIDFEGNPLQRADERGAMRPPARDVASVVRSLDHVGRIVQRRRPDRASDIATWIAAARTSFLESYTSQLAMLGATDLFDERLLHPFEVAQGCHEYVYAARFLPRWRYVPDLAMPPLVRGA
jgi:maltokinase